MPTFNRSRELISCFLAVLLAMPVLAETPDQQLIQELKAENDALRKELSQLRLELSQLKRELEAIEPQEKPNEPKPEDKTKDESRRSDGRQEPFRSADEIFRLIPDYLKPAKDGWDKAQTQTTGNWLRDNITGKQFSARKEISDVTVRYDSIKRLWNVVISFEDEKMSYMGWKMQEKIYPITLLGDKAFAEAAKKKYKPGRTINVSGTITMIRWATIIQHKRDQNWRPEFCQLSIDAIEPR